MNLNNLSFFRLISKEKTTTSQKNKERITNRDILRESKNIAFNVLERIDELGWSQKKLAESMDVSHQYINEMVKGQKPFQLEFLSKLEEILEIKLK